MIDYVLGFAISGQLDRVVLIEKTKPEWQKGKLNGVGGKRENGELPIEVMVREFEEETGVKTTPGQWSRLGSMGSDDGITVGSWNVFIYYLVNDSVVSSVRTTTEEKVAWYMINALPNNVLTNLKWMIPAIIDYLVGCPFTLNAEYKQ